MRPTNIIKDVDRMCKNWRIFYEGQIRSSMNEWMIQEMEERVDELNKVSYKAWQSGVMSKEEYQGMMGAAWGQAAELRLSIRRVEENGKERCDTD